MLLNNSEILALGIMILITQGSIIGLIYLGPEALYPTCVCKKYESRLEEWITYNGTSKTKTAEDYYQDFLNSAPLNISPSKIPGDLETPKKREIGANIRPPLPRLLAPDSKPRSTRPS